MLERSVRLWLTTFVSVMMVGACSDPIVSAPPRGFKIEVIPKFLTMQRLDTVRIRAFVENLDGDTVGGHQLLFQPQDPSMFSIDKFGLVHSLGPVGVALLFLTDPPDNVIDTAYITISTTPLAVRVSPIDTSISSSGTIQYVVTAYDSVGVIPRQPFTLTFRPDTQSLVDAGNGLVHALGYLGDFAVTVTTGSATTHAAVTVQDTLTAGRLPAPGHPASVAVDSRGDGFVSRAGTTFLTHYNTTARSPEASLYVPAGVTSIVLDTAGRRIYIIASLAVYGIDPATGAFVDTLRSASQPLAIGVGADNQTIWISAVGDLLVAFDKGTGQAVKTLSLTSLTHFAVSPPGDTLIYGSVGGAVVEINSLRRTVGRTFAVGGSLTDLAVSPDGATLFAADAAGKRVAVWDLVSGAVIDSIPLPAAPQGLGLARDNAQLWVSLPNLGEVQLFNPATRASLGTITTHGSPRGIGVGPTGTVALVANDSGWVDVIPR